MSLPHTEVLESRNRAVARRTGSNLDRGLATSRQTAKSTLSIIAFATVMLPSFLLGEESLVVVGVTNFPPLVMEVDGGFEGFDIDIWNEVSEEIGIESQFQAMPFGDLLQAVKNSTVDAAIAGISITRDREIEMDFSYPYMNSGLRILTTVEDDPPWLRVLGSLTTRAELGALGYLVGFVLLCSHILYFAERGSSGISDRYFPGILEACWCIVATITTVGYGDVTPRRWFGRFVSLIVMVIGISLFGVAIAQLSAGLMMEALKSDISGPEDLSGRPVATVAGTTSTEVAVRYGARLHEAEDIEAAYRMLQSGEVDAILFDAAPVMRYAAADGNRTVTVVGRLIERQVYGIAFPAGSELRESVNQALLGLEESGKYDRIHRQWFGSSD